MLNLMQGQQLATRDSNGLQQQYGSDASHDPYDNESDYSSLSSSSDEEAITNIVSHLLGGWHCLGI